MKKRVLVFGMTSNPGGVESVIMNYYRYINKEKIQFDFLCNSSQIAYEDEIQTLGGRIYKITARKKNYWKFQSELKHFMRENAQKYDALWVNLCSLVNVDYLISAKKYGIKKRIIHCHNSANDAGILKGVIHFINKKRIPFLATDFWSCSKDAASWFFSKEIIESNKFKIVPNAIDVEKFKPNKILRNKIRTELNLNNLKVIGHVGRFHFQKNHTFLIDIFDNIVKKDDDYRLLLVGQGELYPIIKEKVKNKGLSEKVIFYGVRTDVEKIYQAMDIFILPSIFEGLGVVALEAQACLLPCLLADTVPLTVRINDNTAFLSLNKGAVLWAEKIDEMLRIPPLLNNRMPGSVYDIRTQVKEFEKMLFD